MGFIGYSVGWRSDENTRVSFDYADVRADVFMGGEVFPERGDADIVLAGEKLKSPQLKWQLFEVYEADSKG